MLFNDLWAYIEVCACRVHLCSRVVWMQTLRVLMVVHCHFCVIVSVLRIILTIYLLTNCDSYLLVLHLHLFNSICIWSCCLWRLCCVRCCSYGFLVVATWSSLGSSSCWCSGCWVCLGCATSLASASIVRRCTHRLNCKSQVRIMWIGST